MRIGIVEDEHEAADTLVRNITDYCRENHIKHEITVCFSAAEFSAYASCDFDILFMDVILPDGNGYEIVRDMRSRSINTMVIFVTSMADYAVKGYEVRAFDFIVKPINRYVFRLKFRAAAESICMNAGNTVWLNGKNFRKKLNIEQIYYVDVDSHWLTYHTADGNFRVYGALDKVKRELGGDFEFCNRCYLVNLRHVTGMAEDTVTVGGDELLISRNKKNTFVKALGKYIATVGSG